MTIKKWLLTGLLTVFLTAGAVFSAFAQSGSREEGFLSYRDITMDVTYGYDNLAKGGRYIPLNVTFENSGEEEFHGSIQILTKESDLEVYRYEYPVIIPAGSAGKLLYIPLGNREDQIYVTLADEKGEGLLHKRLKLNFSQDTPELFIGILSDTPEKLVAWNGVGVDYGMLRTRTIPFTTEEFPMDLKGLDLVDVLLISNYRIRDLSEEQSMALVQWVRNGGIMILGTGMRADDTLGRFAPELLEQMYDAPELQQIDMGADYARERPGDAVYELPVLAFSLEGGEAIIADEERVHLAKVTYSQGTIAVAAYDFTDLDEFCRQNPSYIDNLLTRVVGEEGLRDMADPVYGSAANEYWMIRDMINTGNVRRLPSLGLYTMELVIYIFLVGLGLYIFLRQREMTEYYRSGVVGLSLLFTGIIYLMGNRTRITDTLYTYASFLETNYETVGVTTYMNMRAPYNKPYTTELMADYSVRPVTYDDYYFYGADGKDARFTGEEPWQVSIAHEEDRTAISVQNAPAFEPKYFRLEKTEENAQQIGFFGDIEVDRGVFTGSVTNQFAVPVENCAVLLYNKMIYLGTMEPGETRSLDGLEALEYPRNYSYQVAARLSGEMDFAQADINDEAYIEASEKTKLFSFYLDNYMPEYTQTARIVGVVKTETMGGMLRQGTAEGHTVVSSGIQVYPADDQITYRSVMIQTPEVMSGSYAPYTNSLYGVDPVTLEYTLGNDVRIEKLILSPVSETFIKGSSLTPFSGSMYFYNHSTGNFDEMDPVKREYDANELAPYLSPGSTIMIKYVYDRDGVYSWDVLLPALSIVGREY